MKTSPENLARITAMYESLASLMDNLAVRWMDEGKYEDIADYQKAIEKRLPEGFTVTRMVKRPFGFQFKIGTEAEYLIQRSARQYAWKRVG
jgi:hypothetical protein